MLLADRHGEVSPCWFISSTQIDIYIQPTTAPFQLGEVSDYIQYLPEYKSQLQHLFLLLFIKGVSYTPNIQYKSHGRQATPTWAGSHVRAVLCYTRAYRMAKPSYE